MGELQESDAHSQGHSHGSESFSRQSISAREIICLTSIPWYCTILWA